MLLKESLVALVNLSRLMAEKMEKPNLHVRRWVNNQIAIIVAILCYRMIRVDHIPLPCGEVIWTENRFWVWIWSNKLCARIVSRTPAQNSFFSCPTLNFPPILIAQHAIHADYTQRQTPEDRTRVMMKNNKIEEIYWCKNMGIWRKNWYLSGNGKTKETKLYYKSVEIPFIRY